MINSIQSGNYYPAFTSKVIVNKKALKFFNESSQELREQFNSQMKMLETNGAKDLVFIDKLKKYMNMEVCQSVDSKTLQGKSRKCLVFGDNDFNLLMMYESAVKNLLDITDFCAAEVKEYLKNLADEN